jgi:cation:H+ antiporter
MWIDFLMLAIGLALIIKGGDWFVSASVRIAEFLNMPRVVIGSTLVSLTTTSPELVVSIFAGLKQESGLAVGNAVGSCICNIGLILGLMAAMKQVDVHFRILRTPLFTMFFMGALLFLMTLNLGLSRNEGIFLLLLGAAYFAFDFLQHTRHPALGEVEEAALIEREMRGKLPWAETKSGTALFFIMGAALVIVGSSFLVSSAKNIADAIGIPSIIIGLTLVAFGTSLPELVTAITSARRNVSDLAIGNVLGANIANLSLVIGSAASIHEVSMTRLTHVINFPFLLGSMLLFLVMVWSGKGISRREGAVLLVFYAVYIVAIGILAFVTRGIETAAP